MEARMNLWIWVSVWSSFTVMVAYGGGAVASDVRLQGDVMGYWERRLPGTVLPTGLRALVSPMSPLETTQFLTNINAAKREYLPAHAAAFCESAHLKCPQSGSFDRSERHVQIDKMLLPSPEASSGKRPAAASSREAPHFLDLYTYRGSGIEMDTEETLESRSRARLLSTVNVHEFSNAFFLERQVFVRGSAVHVKPSDDNLGAGAGERAFLPRDLAELFPIAGTDGSEIAAMLGVSKESMQETLQFCEGKHGVDEACFTSLEDVADFVWSIVGRGSRKGLQVYDSIRNESEVTGNYFITEDVKVLKGDLVEPAVSCHDLNFPFRVLYCHATNLTRMFEVVVRGEDGRAHEQTVVCHYDTSYWSPKHFAMVLLHVKPGESEACHFMGTNWVQSTGWIFVRGGASAAARG